MSERQTPETEEKFAQELAEDWLVTNGICERKHAQAETYAALRTAYVDGYFRCKEVHREVEQSRDELASALRECVLYMRVETPNACAAFDNARAILAKVKP